jgi:hypothetical protein
MTGWPRREEGRRRIMRSTAGLGRERRSGSRCESDPIPLPDLGLKLDPSPGRTSLRSSRPLGGKEGALAALRFCRGPVRLSERNAIYDPWSKPRKAAEPAMPSCGRSLSAKDQRLLHPLRETVATRRRPRLSLKSRFCQGVKKASHIWERLATRLLRLDYLHFYSLMERSGCIQQHCVAP